LAPKAAVAAFQPERDAVILYWLPRGEAQATGGLSGMGGTPQGVPNTLLNVLHLNVEFSCK
jgi:hypothetical protein